MMEAMIPPQVGMRFRAGKKEKKRQKKERRPKEKNENERKRKKGQCYYPFATLVLQSSTMFFI